jgi:ATP-independent RNA helicase DbpA
MVEDQYTQLKANALHLAQKAGITELNALQEKSLENSIHSRNKILIAATGSGKTLGYLLPILAQESHSAKTLIIAPTRELAMQIDRVVRSLQTGLHVVLCYGGHSFKTEVDRLMNEPDIIIGTPGRLIDHIEKANLQLSTFNYLVIDEYDKCLEMGFEDQIQRIERQVPKRLSTVLVSATALNKIPEFLKSIHFETIHGSAEISGKLDKYVVEFSHENRFDILHALLKEQQGRSTIVFCNLRETIGDVYDYLTDNHFDCTVYHGGMEQVDRERSIIQFSNGTYHTMICTDIGARGLDIEGIDSIVHFELPREEATFIHRNGRTARMGKNGSIYVFSPKTNQPEWLKSFDGKAWTASSKNSSFQPTKNVTIYFSAGKKDKIRKIDLVGTLIQLGQLQKEEIGQIHVMDRVSFVAVPRKKYSVILERLRDQKVKGKKLRIALAKGPNMH